MNDWTQVMDILQEEAGVGAGIGVTIQSRMGPGDPSGLRRCVRCLGEFQPGETWLRITPADGGYAIGVHLRCYLAGTPPAA